MPNDNSFGACDLCGTFTHMSDCGPILVGRTPIRNVMGFDARCCPACRDRYQGAPILEIMRSLHETDSQIRSLAAKYYSHKGVAYGTGGPLKDGLKITIRRQVGEVAAALRLRPQF